MIQIFKKKPAVNIGKPSQKEFKKLDRIYTRPEYEKLFSLLSYSILSVILKASFKDTLQNIRKSPDRNYQYLSEYIYGTSEYLFIFMYKKDLDDLPMSINHKIDTIKSVIKWRMEIRK